MIHYVLSIRMIKKIIMIRYSVHLDNVSFSCKEKSSSPEMSDLKIEIKQRCQWTTNTMNKYNKSRSIRVMKNCAGPLNLHLFFIFLFCLVLVFKIGFQRLLRYCQLCYYCYCLCFLLSFIIIYIFIWATQFKRTSVWSFKIYGIYVAL